MRSVLFLALVVALPGYGQWEIQAAPTTADLRGIHAVGNGVAWASGTQGTVLRTVDDGKSWARCATPPGAEGLDFRGVQALDANTAIVMSSGKGDLSRLYKTVDGCKNWKLLFVNLDPDGFWDDIALAPQRLGKNGSARDPGPLYVLGDPIKMHFVVWVMRKPLQSGELPKRLSDLPRAKPGESAFAASNSVLYPVQYPPLLFFPAGLAFATGGAQEAHWLRLIEDGADTVPTWHSSIIPVGNGSATSGVFSVAASPTAGVAVGGDFSKPDDTADNAAYTRDGGKRWASSLPDSSPHGYRSAVVYDDAAKTWITVGPNGTDVSMDDGRNWRALRPDAAAGDAADADRNWNALSLPFVVGPGGRIGKLRAGALNRNPPAPTTDRASP